jgi:hypothetical protein
VLELLGLLLLAELLQPAIPIARMASKNIKIRRTTNPLSAGNTFLSADYKDKIN